jgi:hypothetical protein
MDRVFIQACEQDKIDFSYCDENAHTQGKCKILSAEVSIYPILLDYCLTYKF